MDNIEIKNQDTNNQTIFNLYNNKIENDVNEIFTKINKIKSKGIDGDFEINITKANSLIERVIGLISIINSQLKNKEIQDKIKKRIIELEEKYHKSDWRVAMQISLDFANNNFIQFKTKKEAIELGIRFGFGYITSGIVSAPIEGFIGLDIKKTQNNNEYFSLKFAGPIRNAGGTAASVCVLIADYIRQKLGYAKYDPTDIEINRTHIELTNYHERISNLQYFPSKEETLFFFKNIPIQIDGDPTSEIEVFNYKNIPRIKTNRIRGGFCLVCSECLQLKAQKLEKRINEFKNELEFKDWDFLTEYLTIQKQIKSQTTTNNNNNDQKNNQNKNNEKVNNQNSNKNKISKNFSYLKEISAGKPVFAYPMQPGFRLRYGRTKISGYSCVGINPLSMKILNNFLATGTQIKTERPFKGATTTPCDSIEGPIILTNNNEIIKIDSEEKYNKNKKNIKKILHIGDILINYGDFLNRNHPLIPSGYVEEWWIQDFNKKLKENNININSNNDISKFLELPKENTEKIIKNYLKYNISFLDSLKITEKLKIPLHPKHLLFASNLDIYEYNVLINNLTESEIFFNQNKNKTTENRYINFYETLDTIRIPNKKIKIEETEKETTIKEIINKLYIESQLQDNQIIIKNDNAKTFLFYFIQINKKEIEDFTQSDIYKTQKNFKDENNYSKEFSKLFFFKEKIITEDIFKQINQKYSFETIKKKNSTYIGLRLGRPEKSKPREIKNNPNGLFTLSETSNNLLDMSKTNNNKIYSQKYICPECNLESPLPYCIKCNIPLENEKFSVSWKDKKLNFGYWDFESKKFFDIFKEKYKISDEELEETKPIKNLNNIENFSEHYLKGILRNKYNLNSNKDGTIRYDATESPMTHFTPKEINVTVEKLKKLGYKYDINNKIITNENQTIEIFPQDIIIPNFKEYNTISSVDFFFNVTKYIDELLKKLYNTKSHYNLNSKEEIIGQYAIALAPHTSAGIVTRIIGFSNTQCIFAHPLLHANLRRDCDGDEAGLMLLLDGVLNFSTNFIPSSRGATMDRPLVLSILTNPTEVDDMAFDVDIEPIYNLNFYHKSESFESPKVLNKEIKKIGDIITNNYKYNQTKFTHTITNINISNNISSYKYLPTMFDKVKSEVNLMTQLQGVDEKNAIELMIKKFFIKDMKGNIKKFSRQSIRCTKCNHIMRRPPLNGKCNNCKEQNLVFTIAPNSIIKYNEIMKYLDTKIDKKYTHEILEFLFTRLNTIIKKDNTSQLELF